MVVRIDFISAVLRAESTSSEIAGQLERQSASQAWVLCCLSIVLFCHIGHFAQAVIHPIALRTAD